MKFRRRWWPVIALASSAFAHDLQVSFERVDKVVVTHALYAGTEACAYASVLVYAPGEAKTEHQNGRTDAKGLFAFVPDRAGTWRVVVDDEMGHRKDMTVDVAAGGELTPPMTAMPVWQKALTGASLILALTGFLYGWKSRRSS